MGFPNLLQFRCQRDAPCSFRQPPALLVQTVSLRHITVGYIPLGRLIGDRALTAPQPSLQIPAARIDA